VKSSGQKEVIFHPKRRPANSFFWPKQTRFLATFRRHRNPYAMGIHLLNDLLDDLAILFKNGDYEGVMQRIATYYYDGPKFSSKDFTIYFISILFYLTLLV
jgi:hypothetical protein